MEGVGGKAELSPESSRKEDAMDIDRKGDTNKHSTPKVIRNIYSEKDNADVLYSLEYVEEIFSFEKEMEKKYRLNPECMKNLNEGMRLVLVNWLVDVSEEYRLTNETLHTSIVLTDRYLSIKLVPRCDMQLLGITCMLLASKIEEIYAPSLDEFVYICDNAYTKERMLDMEEDILNTLKFSVRVSPPILFMRRYMLASGGDANVNMLALYLCDLTILDHRYAKFLPSMVAISSVILALHTYGHTYWDETLEHYSEYKMTDSNIIECMDMMLSSHRMEYHSRGRNIEGLDGKEHKMNALYNKYSHNKYLNIARTAIPPERLPAPISLMTM